MVKPIVLKVKNERTVMAVIIIIIIVIVKNQIITKKPITVNIPVNKTKFIRHIQYFF